MKTMGLELEFVSTSQPENQRKFLIALEKKLINLKDKTGEINKSKTFSEDERSMHLTKIKKEITTLRGQRKDLQTCTTGLRIKHKNTGITCLYKTRDYKSALKNIRNKIRNVRKEQKFTLISKRKLGNAKFNQDIVTLQKIGGTYFKSDTFKNINKVKQLEKSKEPKTDANYLGIEIEFASFLSKTDLVNRLVENNLSDCCQLHHEYIEGRHTGENEYEISMVVSEQEYKEKLETLCTVLNEEADANVTYGCGLHVHIDCRNRNVKTVYNNLFFSQPLLYSMVNPHRKNNRFAQQQKDPTWYPIKSGWFCDRCEETSSCSCKTKDHIPKDGQERYYGINTWSYIKHKTIEVRLHSGSTNVNKINNWVQLLLLIANAPQIGRNIENANQLNKIVEVNSVLTRYINNRIENFKQKEN